MPTPISIVDARRQADAAGVARQVSWQIHKHEETIGPAEGDRRRERFHGSFLDVIGIQEIAVAKVEAASTNNGMSPDRSRAARR